MKNRIEYFNIIKEAINITLKNRILWWFGLLAIFSGGYGSFNFRLPSGSGEGDFDEMEYMNMIRRATFYWDLYKEWIILGIVILLIILIGLYILGIIGRGALIDSIFKVIKKEAFTFSSGFKRGLYFLGRIFLMDLLFTLVFLVSIFVLAFPVVRLVILESYGVAILLGIVALLILISLGILFFYIRRYAQIYLISSDLNVSNSVKLAYGLFEKNIKESLIMGIVSIGINFVIGIVFVFVFLLLLIPGSIIGVLVYNTGQQMIMIIAGILAIILFIGLTFFISSILNVFFETMWILFFNEIGKSREDGIALKEEGESVNLNGEPESIIT